MNECYMCINFKKYYTKGLKKFDPTDIGWCCEIRDNVNIHGGCEKFRRKLNRRKSNLAIKHRLSDLLIELTEIRCMLEEDGNDKEL